MEEMLTDPSTGFVPEEELLALAAMPDSLEAGGGSLWDIIVTISHGIGDICPTTACTSMCPGRTG